VLKHETSTSSGAESTEQRNKGNQSNVEYGVGQTHGAAFRQPESVGFLSSVFFEKENVFIVLFHQKPLIFSSIARMERNDPG